MARLEVLWCERGGHQWRRPVRPGRPPNSCPEHARVLDERLVRYPDEDKPLAPRFVSPLLDVPITRFYFGPMPPGITRLAELDLATSAALRPAARRQLARAVHETIRERWRTVAHQRPFVDLPEGIDLLKLPIGANTRNCLSEIPAGYLGEMDVGALFGIHGFGPKSLLDVTSAIDAVGHPASERGSPVDGEIVSATEDAVLVENEGRVEPVETEALSRLARRFDPMASLPLDVVVQGSPMARPGLWLVDHWDDLSASALPEPARGVVLAGGTAQEVLAALIDPAAVQGGAHQLLNDLRDRLGAPSRQWEITLERSGFGADAAVTLAAIGDRLGLTRERVRQLALPISALREQVRPHDPLALSLQAWFALNPGRPLGCGRLAELCSSMQVERAALLVLDGLRYPYLDRGDRYWVARGDELRALRAVAGRTDLVDESVAGEAVKKTAAELPGVERVLDLAYVVTELTTPAHSRVAQRSPFSSIPSGLGGSLVRKIVTYLVNRAAAVDVDELAGVIEAGHWPFEVLDLTTIDPEYLRALARAHPDLLSYSDDDRINLGSARADRSPSGNVGALHRILSDAGGPLSTARLKELAAKRGIGANTLGVLVHGNRAPCLIPVARGMVGLVGRDEHWTPSSSDLRPASPADDPRCFFLPEGWGVKLQVDRELLQGGSWEVPPRLADHLGFRRRRVVRLTSEDAGFAALLLEPKVHSCIGRSLEAGLHSVGAADGDTVFVVLGAGVYTLLFRGHAESEERDPLRQLLAGCGLDPDSTIAADPWSRVARALGATGTSRQAVRGRLQLRGQVDMLKLVDAAQLRRGPTGPEIWPVGWSYIAPLDEGPSRYAVRASQGALRVAVGVLARGVAVPDFAIVGESGLVWIDVGEAEASERAQLAAAAWTTPDAAWVRWARAEHAARRVALSGEHWEIIIEPRAYAVGGSLHDDLAGALEAVGTLEADAEPLPPSEPARNGYPRGALAFAQAVRGARRNGLLRLVADSDAGFRADYQGARVVRGPTLADVLSLASSSTT